MEPDGVEPRYPVAPADRAAMVALLSHHWPTAYRLAAGLCGRVDVAAAVAERVLDRAAAAAPRWRSAEQAGRWFTRYTVLRAREARPNASPDDVPGLAWLRPLPSQQREAIILNHGLGLDLHRMAAAMDCSTRAAANHLVAATTHLRTAGPLDDWTASLPACLAAVVPPPATVSADVSRVVARRWRWAVVRRAAACMFVASSLGVATWFGWRLWQMLLLP